MKEAVSFEAEQTAQPVVRCTAYPGEGLDRPLPRVILSTLLALALAGCQTIKPLPPTGRVIPCSTVAEVRPNIEAIDAMSDRVARQTLGNDLVISKLCQRKAK